MTAPHSDLPRRSLLRGTAWAAPTAIVSVAAPAVAASLRKDPGINGWVNNSYRGGSCRRTNSSIEVTSIGSGSTPDGAPFGLYLYDTEDVDTVDTAQLTYWVLGVHGTESTDSTRITWSVANGHSSCWSYAGRVGTEEKPDGLTYTGYRWTYNCTIDPHNITNGTDGVARAFLGNFHVTTGSFRQPQGSCGKLNFWTQRTITIDGEVYTFQRRNGTDGPYATARRRSAPAPAASDGGGEAPAAATATT